MLIHLFSGRQLQNVLRAEALATREATMAIRIPNIEPFHNKGRDKSNNTVIEIAAVAAESSGLSAMMEISTSLSSSSTVAENSNGLQKAYHLCRLVDCNGPLPFTKIVAGK